MYVGVADAARMHFHQHLIRSGLRLRNVLDLPRTTDSGNDRSFHNISSYRVSMRENFRSGLILRPKSPSHHTRRQTQGYAAHTIRLIRSDLRSAAVNE